MGKRKYHTEEERLEADRLSKQKYVDNNSEKVKASQKKANKKWKDSNLEYNNEHSKKWNKKNPEKVKSYRLKREFGITLEQYNIMFTNQNGKCLICLRHQSEFKRALAVDHNHETGEIRGLLCHKCNTAIGLLHDNIDILNNAIKYLKK